MDPDAASAACTSPNRGDRPRPPVRAARRPDAVRGVGSPSRCLDRRRCSPGTRRLDRRPTGRSARATPRRSPSIHPRTSERWATAVPSRPTITSSRTSATSPKLRLARTAGVRRARRQLAPRSPASGVPRRQASRAPRVERSPGTHREALPERASRARPTCSFRRCPLPTVCMRGTRLRTPRRPWRSAGPPRGDGRRRRSCTTAVPPHRAPAFADLGFGLRHFPGRRRTAATVLSLPIGPQLDDEAVTFVIDAVRAFTGA